MFESQETKIFTEELRADNVEQDTRIFSGELRPSGPALGTILRERYRLDSELGRGGMGTAQPTSNSNAKSPLVSPLDT